MYLILYFITSILLVLGFLVLKKNYSRKEVFLQNSIDQLILEKTVLDKEMHRIDKLTRQLEIELVDSHRINLDLREKTERIENENLALRNIIEGLQKKRDPKNEDIIVEYIFKP